MPLTIGEVVREKPVALLDAPPSNPRELDGVEGTAINSTGGYAVTVLTTPVDAPPFPQVSHIWGSESPGEGRILRTESTIGLLRQEAFTGTLGITNDGRLVYGALVTDVATGEDDLDSVWFDDTLLAREGLPAELVPGATWSGSFSVGVTSHGVPYWTGSLFDEHGQELHGAFVGESGRPVFVSGQEMPGLGWSIAPGEPIREYEISPLAEHSAAILALDTGAPSPREYVALDGVLLALSSSLLGVGEEVPEEVGGQPGEHWETFCCLGINDSGEWAVGATTSSPEGSTNVLLVDGRLIYREGDQVGNQTLDGDVVDVAIGPDGDVTFVWEDTVPFFQQNLFLNDRVLAVGAGTEVHNRPATVTNFRSGTLRTTRRGDRGLLASYWVGTLFDDVQVEQWQGFMRMVADPTLRLSLNQGLFFQGQESTVEASGAQPGDVVHFVRGRNGLGDGPCSDELALCFDIEPPLRPLGNALADSHGRAELLINVPATASEEEVYMQAFVTRGPEDKDSAKSSVGVEPIRPSQTAMWEETSTKGPRARGAAPMVFDSANEKVVLYGGSTSLGCAPDTWLWDGSGWSLASISGPGARTGHSMSYDNARSRVVVFGGLAGFDILGDTWEWDGREWSEVPTATGPPVRFGAAMAFDPVRQVTVLYGGSGLGGELGDTWLWDGKDWIEVVAPSPGLRARHRMVYDSFRDVMVVHGGCLKPDGQAVCGESGDTWVWDGESWNMANHDGPIDSDFAMAFDGIRGLVVLFNSDTWEWDGAVWRQTALQGTIPPPRSLAWMAFDGARGYTLMFGGKQSVDFLDDTWIYR